MNEPQQFLLVLRVMPQNRNASVRYLRRFLKRLSRSFGFVCLECSAIDPKGQPHTNRNE